MNDLDAQYEKQLGGNESLITILQLCIEDPNINTSVNKGWDEHKGTGKPNTNLEMSTTTTANQ